MKQIKGKYFLIILTLFLGMFLANNLMGQAISLDVLSIPIAVRKNQAKWFENNRGINTCPSFESLSKKSSARIHAEIWLLCKALELSGKKFKFNFKISPNVSRDVQLVSSGKVFLAAQSQWQSRIKKANLSHSFPIIVEGSFEKGIYFLEEKILNNKITIKNLSNYVGVIPNSWAVDLEALQELELSVVHISNYSNIFSFLKKNRADFSILEFPSTNGLSKKFGEQKLLPLPDYKIALQESRHFVFNLYSDISRDVFDMVNTGLLKLEEQGMIDKALIKVGFINQQVKDWAVIKKSDIKAPTN